MPSQEEIDRQRNLLEINRRNLAHFIQQATRYGDEIEAPIHVVNSLAATRAGIARLKDILRGWDVQVDDHPDDLAPPPPDPSLLKRQSLGGTNVNIYGGTFSGPVAQTGGSSVNNVFNQPNWQVAGNVYNIAGDLNIGANPGKDEFLVALRQFKSEIDKAQDLPAGQADELKEDVDSAIKAIDKPQPNKERAVERLTTIQKVLDGLKGNVGSALALGNLIGQAIQAAQGITF